MHLILGAMVVVDLVVAVVALATQALLLDFVMSPSPDVEERLFLWGYVVSTHTVLHWTPMVRDPEKRGAKRHGHQKHDATSNHQVFPQELQSFEAL